MTELSYTKSFLSMLAPRPLRLSADHVEDPRKLPARVPYTLPRTLPEKKKRQRISTTNDATVTITLKPLRPNPALAPLSLPSIPLSTTVASLKQKYLATLPAGTDTSKLKLLLKGKPVSDVKTLSELGFKDGEDVTITVMLMGGAAAAAPPASSSSPPVPEVDMKEPPNKTKALSQEAFWEDLKVFLEETLGREDVEEDPKKVLQVFRAAWRG
ncbi:hypothetical protein FN846DRAFT_454768 [Sphaerosporella brunnea]|uniref:Ubiquitin-like domain-containing protein n=1 Tax=Sphaerosporella brunnea TaxID=1250544 RepID=A0A5J5EFE4_9PEZI|nr:hypothetical protein FN846DRAFT_454768 [Sphaerosporella brunnea]